jgi:hypothetical protein
MNKGWRVIGTIVLILVLLGAICIGVGFMTGGDIGDIYAPLNVRYNLIGHWEQYSNWALTTLKNIAVGVRGLW